MAAGCWRVPPLLFMNALFLTGGGCLGYGQALLLNEMETQWCTHVHKSFGLVAGTSVGCIVGAAVVTGVPSNKLLNFFVSDAPKIFSSTIWNNVCTWLQRGAKYDAQPLEAALQDMLGDATLADCKTPFMATSYDVNTDRPVYFHSWEKSREDNDVILIGYDTPIKLWQVCRASSAAQAYFQAYPWDGLMLMDGGNTGDNAPDVLAHAEAQSFDDPITKVLSIGTGNSRWTVNGRAMRNPSLLRAAFTTIKIVFAAGEGADIYKARKIFGLGYNRIQPDLGAGIAIDDAKACLNQIPGAVVQLQLKLGPAFFDQFRVAV